jgi:hypothetical protein
MRKLRKNCAVDQNGVTIPRLPRVTDADKPHGWKRWSAAERVEYLLGLRLDRVHIISRGCPGFHPDQYPPVRTISFIRSW